MGNNRSACDLQAYAATNFFLDLAPLGRPPFEPFTRAARDFAALFALPPALASCRIQTFAPNSFSNRPGTLIAIFNASQNNPSPEGSTFTLASSDGLASLIPGMS